MNLRRTATDRNDEVLVSESALDELIDELEWLRKRTGVLEAGIASLNGSIFEVYERGQRLARKPSTDV